MMNLIRITLPLCRKAYCAAEVLARKISLRGKQYEKSGRRDDFFSPPGGARRRKGAFSTVSGAGRA
jgi:hypothetical protein